MWNLFFITLTNYYQHILDLDTTFVKVLSWSDSSFPGLKCLPLLSRMFLLKNSSRDDIPLYNRTYLDVRTTYGIFWLFRRRKICFELLFSIFVKYFNIWFKLIVFCEYNFFTFSSFIFIRKNWSISVIFCVSVSGSLDDNFDCENIDYGNLYNDNLDCKNLSYYTLNCKDLNCENFDFDNFDCKNLNYENLNFESLDKNLNSDNFDCKNIDYVNLKFVFPWKHMTVMNVITAEKTGPKIQGSHI